MILNSLGSIYILLTGKWMECKIIPQLFQKDHNSFDQVQLSIKSKLEI